MPSLHSSSISNFNSVLFNVVECCNYNLILLLTVNEFIFQFAGDWRVARVRKVFLCFYTLSRKFCCFLGHPVGFFINFEVSYCCPKSVKLAHQRELFFIRVLKVTGKRFATETNQRNRPETRGSRRSLSDHSWCKRKILDLPSTTDSTNTLQSEFRFGALGTKGSRRKLTKKTVRRPGKAAEVPLTISGAREKSSTYPVLQIALTHCRILGDWCSARVTEVSLHLNKL
ncbi:hypothetical protein PUN28_011267 [Cardiocondyla obscurior]|uniref:Uncharacterized protein n=1 Tax=Cardiocondyla obscurior TaxID=286306 RepID=A0AAW2FNQ8_9HYME